MLNTTIPVGNKDGICLLSCVLIRTTKRLTFEILFQDESVTNTDDTGIKTFRASNGYEIISEHRMDIQSRRLWLWGAADDAPAIRSGSMVVPVESMADDGMVDFLQALTEWARHNGGWVKLTMIDTKRSL